MDTKGLFEMRKRIKSKKPKFRRQDFHKKPNLKRKWRRPKGLHSKIRLKIRGKGKIVSPGYRSPRKVRSMHKNGLEEKRISSVKDLEYLNPKKYGLIISSSVGNKKKIAILKKIKDDDFKILSIKNPNDYIKKVEEIISAKKKAKQEKKKISKVKKGEKEEKLSDKLSEGDEEKSKKEEKDRVLTKRQR